MESWKNAQRDHERRLWGTLLCVGVALTAALSSSLLAAAISADPGAAPWFYLQQSVLLVLTVAGTALALRRWRSARIGGAG
jgi:cobalamin biosynthesis protein CobD/CbiB